MPQPLEKFDPQFSSSNRVVRFSGVGTHDRRSSNIFRGGRAKFGALAMETIAKWAAVENELISSVSSFVYKGDEELLDEFRTLRARGSRLAVFRVISRLHLGSEQRHLVDRVLRLYASCEKRRNILAHHAWGFLDDRSDVVLLIDYRDWVGKERSSLLSKAMVWNAKDFDELATDIIALNSCLRRLTYISSRMEKKIDAEATKSIAAAITAELDKRGI